MNFFMENFYCWIRNKEPTSNANQDQKEKINNQTKQQLICGGCFKDIESLEWTIFDTEIILQKEIKELNELSAFQ